MFMNTCIVLYEVIMNTYTTNKMQVYKSIYYS